mmetsp:Transcript_16050/g.13579  ORF Transcript_16050/g.13579 Transcript_16050/m.13579 type:complete len:144 (-) Transcript_16050:239-670(-)
MRISPRDGRFASSRLTINKKYLTFLGYTADEFIKSVFEKGMLIQSEKDFEKHHEKEECTEYIDFLYNTESLNRYRSSENRINIELKTGFEVESRIKQYVLERFEDGIPSYDVVRAVVGLQEKSIDDDRDILDEMSLIKGNHED